jgi:hypothetical protein
MSRAAGIPDLDLIAGDDHRDFPNPSSKVQHPRSGGGFSGYVKILEIHTLLLVVLPGPGGEGSDVLAEDDHFFLHIASSIWITWMP